MPRSNQFLVTRQVAVTAPDCTTDSAGNDVHTITNKPQSMKGTMNEKQRGGCQRNTPGTQCKVTVLRPLGEGGPFDWGRCERQIGQIVECIAFSVPGGPRGVVVLAHATGQLMYLKWRVTSTGDLQTYGHGAY
jgi:hypothetical protein